MIDRTIIFIPSSQKGKANGFAKQMDKDTGGDKTFGNVILSQTGLEPVTYYACATAISEETRIALPGFKAQIAGSEYYLESEGWTWKTAKADIGLISIDEGV